LDVGVQTKTLVPNIENDIVTIKQGEQVKTTASKRVLWAAGLKGSGMGKVLIERTRVERDHL
jgi:NADH dehydrogenase